MSVLSDKWIRKMSKEKDMISPFEEKFKKSEFTYMLIYRFIGGIPFAISNVLPCIFNVKVSNFFWTTILGISPQLFLICSIGSGLDKIVNQNLETPRISDLITSPDIYLPFIFFGCLVLITLFARKTFYKK